MWRCLTSIQTLLIAITEAGSIAGLKKLIKNTASDVTVAMVHKFGDRTDEMEKFPVLNDSKRILVMIDEAHRSEYSTLTANMWRSMPNSVKIAFTGTPITKTTETFGDCIDTYTNQASYDKAQLAVRAMETYAQAYVGTQNLKAVDAISGAAIAYNQFREERGRL